MKTNLELYLSAQDAAKELLGAKTNHEVHSYAIEKFNASGHAKEDYDYWYQHFGNLRQYMIGLSSQETTGSIAAKKAEAEAKKKADAETAAQPVQQTANG